MQPFIASQIRSSPASSSARDIVRLLVGALHLRRSTARERAAISSICLARGEGIGHLDACRFWRAARFMRFSSASVTTKPPPIE